MDATSNNFFILSSLICVGRNLLLLPMARRQTFQNTKKVEPIHYVSIFLCEGLNFPVK